MIFEYAIEPEVASGWGRDLKDYRYFYEKFGYGQPRIASAYPSKKKWRNKAREAIPSEGTEIQKQRSTEMLAMLLESMARRYTPAWSESLNWVENAEAEHARQAFQLIIADSNPDSSSHVCIPSQLSPGNACWEVLTGYTVNRTPTDLANALSPVLSIAGQIIFVDPFFSPDNAGKRAMLKAYLDACYSRPSFQLAKVTLHVKAHDNELIDKTYETNCNRDLPNIVPRGLELTIRRWIRKSGGPNIHNRYVLTELGGIQLGQSMQPDKNDQDDVTLMSKTQYVERWNTFYTDIHNRFTEVAPCITVKGT